MGDNEFEKKKGEESTLEVQIENRKVERTEAITAGSSDIQLWSTCIRKLICALAATLIGGALVYFICRWLIK